MSKKSKIILSIVAVFTVLIGGFVFSVAKELKQEEKMKKEVSKMFDIVDKNEIDYKKANKFINRTVSKGDAEIVEEAVKEYAHKFIEFNKLFDEIKNNNELQNLMGVENIRKDGPDFKNSFKMISEAEQKIKIMISDLEYFSNKDGKALEFIKHKTDNEYYINLYKELTIDNNLIFNSDNTELMKAINNIDKINNTQKQGLNFLKNNASTWQIKNGNIEFQDQKTLELFQEIYAELIEKD